MIVLYLVPGLESEVRGFTFCTHLPYSCRQPSSRVYAQASRVSVVLSVGEALCMAYRVCLLHLVVIFVLIVQYHNALHISFASAVAESIDSNPSSSQPAQSSTAADRFTGDEQQPACRHRHGMSTLAAAAARNLGKSSKHGSSKKNCGIRRGYSWSAAGGGGLRALSFQAPALSPSQRVHNPTTVTVVGSSAVGASALVVSSTSTSADKSRCR